MIVNIVIGILEYTFLKIFKVKLIKNVNQFNNFEYYVHVYTNKINR